ncbi:carbohydrate ABC transporter permease [Paenibacillus oralis]|uniref:Carbohydrate ABC transporter permease n=1 Tax=Paenibacillus oralis TaxID=2490856 RepID=A0A3P3UAF8_9BACL|nr:carbohydrate ABC transporter permease [Paenibacillus oralis]RRJ67300.1 carbohydrate ABC transporter permease [Paenibacillus oralis]
MGVARSFDRLRRNIGGGLYKGLLTVLLLIWTVPFVFPIIVTVTHAFMSEKELARELTPISGDSSSMAGRMTEGNEFVQLSWIPLQATLNAFYDTLVGQPQYLLLFWNSVKLTVPIVAGQLVVASMAGYAFSQLRFRLRKPLFFVYITVMMMPLQVTLVPNFIMVKRLGLFNSDWSIILPGIFGAFGVFLMRQFMQAVPYAYIEAARMDGAGHKTIMIRIVLPMCRSGLAALAILTFIDNWNLVEQPLVFLQDAFRQPLSVYLTAINEKDRAIAFAASVLYMMPAILLMMYAENDLIEGIQTSGIKG